MLLIKKIDRVKMEVNEAANGGHIIVSVPDGWNDHCPIVRLTITRDELRDLKYLVDCALVAIKYEDDER